MKEITTYGDQYGKWYEVKGTDGYYKTFRNYHKVLIECFVPCLEDVRR